MAIEAPAKTMHELARRAGPHGAGFVRYACHELWATVRAMALADGLTVFEAEELARQTVHGAVNAHASGLRAMIKIRHLRGEL